MEFFEQGVCTVLESFPIVRQMKEEQSMIVRKIVGRDVLQNCQQILPGICKALREACKDWKKERDWPTRTPTFVTFVHLLLCNFQPINTLLLLICLLRYVLYGI